MKTYLCILASLVLLNSASLKATEPNKQSIKTNQLGFLPNDQKIAVVPFVKATHFTLIDSTSNKQVYKGKLSAAQLWPFANETVKRADFSHFTQQGNYILHVDGLANSHGISIANHVYANTLKKAIKAYYLIRSGIEIDKKYAGKYARPAAHLDNVVYVHSSAADSKRPENTILSSPKGWYDAGDYNKYIVNSNITVYTLLAAFEENQNLQQLSLNIPESTNELPDVLDEILWNIDWMLTMQDPNDGGVYHKLTTKKFTAFGRKPESITDKRYVVAKSIDATIGFAAVMAQASRLLKPYKKQLPGYSKKLLNAAEKAWAWSEQNPDKRYYQPKDIKTGTYVQHSDSTADEWDWAAAELFATTNNKKYLRALKFTAPLTAPNWHMTQSLALFTLAKSENTPAKLRKKALTQLQNFANKWLKIEKNSAYQLAISKADFVWGSNAVLMNNAIVLLRLNKLSANKKYVNTAHSLFDYVVGRNPLGYSYITGIGYNAVNNIHHRLSVVDNIKAAYPGLLSGGPQSGQQDAGDCEKEDVSYQSKLPALSYIDKTCSFASNEIAINWNAPLVYVLAALQE